MTTKSYSESGPRATSKNKTNQKLKQRRAADPFFKRLLTEIALEVGLTKGPTELQTPRTTLADMFLSVPSNISLKLTVLAFLRPYNIIEFKGQHDHFSKEDFETQLARVHFWHRENAKLGGLEEVLNVIVSSRYPTTIFNYSMERGCPFIMEGGQEWLWQARIGWQDVVIVVCKKLPVEERYYKWLAFAPATSENFKALALKMAHEGNLEMLRLLLEIQGKGVIEMKVEIEEILAAHEPEEAIRLRQEWGEIIVDWLPTASPELKQKAFAKVPPEELLAGLKPEERVAGLRPEDLEQLVSKLTPEQRQAIIKGLQGQN